MSSVVNPNGAVVSLNDPTRYSILSSTATTPIVVTMSAVTLAGIGDFVEITGHAGNVAANGKWQLSNVAGGGTQWTLAGSASLGTAGGATGYGRDFSVTPQITIPSTGDSATAASVDTPIASQVAPAIPYLMQRMGNWRLHYADEIGLYVPSLPGPGSGLGSQSYQWLSVSTGGSSASLPSPFPIVLPDVPLNETVYIDVTMPITLTTSGTTLSAVYPIVSNASGPALYGYGYTQTVPYPSGTAPLTSAVYPYVLRCAGLVPTGSPPSLSVNWQYETLVASFGSTISATGACVASVRIWRQ